MLGQILAFLAALPKLIELVLKLQKELGPDWDQALIDGVRGYQKLRDAKGPEERHDAEKDAARGWMPR